jgi:hypothetical protein
MSSSGWKLRRQKTQSRGASRTKRSGRAGIAAQRRQSNEGCGISQFADTHCSFLLPLNFGLRIELRRFNLAPHRFTNNLDGTGRMRRDRM